MKRREDELLDRAQRIMGVQGRPMVDKEDLRRIFRRQVKLVHPDVNRNGKAVETMALVTAAYEYLTELQPKNRAPLEDDDLVSSLIGEITPIAETETTEQWSYRKFYCSSLNSIWPEPSERQKEEMKYKFTRGSL